MAYVAKLERTGRRRPKQEKWAGKSIKGVKRKERKASEQEACFEQVYCKWGRIGILEGMKMRQQKMLEDRIDWTYLTEWCLR